jgi:hypothetical protein
MLRKTVSLAVLALLVGCAANPSGQPPADVVPTKLAATEAKEASTLDEALRLGYKIVDEDGRRIYCKESKKLGSRVQKERTCMTESEFLAARENSQRGFENMKPHRVPPQGLEGGS